MTSICASTAIAATESWRTNAAAMAVHGPINCLSCRAPQLAVSRGGFPMTSPMSVETSAFITRWLEFLQWRVKQPILFQSIVVIDAEKAKPDQPELMKVCIPPRTSDNLRARTYGGRWSRAAHSIEGSRFTSGPVRDTAGENVTTVRINGTGV